MSHFVTQNGPLHIWHMSYVPYTWYNSVSIQFVWVWVFGGEAHFGGCTQKYYPEKMGWYPAMCSLCYWWLNSSLNDLNDCIIFIILTLLFCSNLILDKLDKNLHKSVSPPLTSSKKLSTGGYMGNWTKYMWSNPKYCNTEAKNTLDARCISIQCWYDWSNIIWKKFDFPTYFVCTTPSGIG